MGAGTDLSRARALGEGTRRSLRVWAQDLRWERFERLEPDGEDEQRTSTACMRVRFVLPKGAYATTVLACAFGIERASSVATSQDEPSASEEEEPS